MRAVIQRCTKASVSVENEVISSIGKGLCVLIGISKHDKKEDMDYIALKGNKPDFHMSMAPDTALQFYSEFVAALKQNYCEERVKVGKFGAYSQIHIQNDGPVTINLESPSSSKNESQSEE